MKQLAQSVRSQRRRSRRSTRRSSGRSRGYSARNLTSRSTAPGISDAAIASGRHVALVAHWQAHTECVNNVEFVDNPTCVITCSEDGTAAVWSLQGVKWGELDTCATTTEPPELWHFPVDVATRQDEKMGEASEVLKDVRTVVTAAGGKGVRVLTCSAC